MESGKSLLILLLTICFSFVLPVCAEEAKPNIKFVNPITNLPAPGSRIKIDFQAENLEAGTEVYLATILDDQLTLIKAQHSEAPGGLSFFAFPAPLLKLKYFSVAILNQQVITQTESKEINRNCLPVNNSDSAEKSETGLNLLTKAKELEQEIQNLEQSQKSLEKIKAILGKQNEEA